MARNIYIYTMIFLFGGMLYCGLELLFRGRTHLSMFIAGGICAVLLYTIATKSRVPAWKKWIAGGAVITTVEFIVGAIVNIALGLAVWDYSHMRMNLMGQISLQFFFIWIILSIPVIWISEFVDSRLAAARGSGHD